MDAFLEIELRLAGHHRGEMEDHVGPADDGSTRRRGIGDIGGAALDTAGETLRLLRRAYVDQREFVDRIAVERAGSDQARHELAPDHSGGASDQNVHGLPGRQLSLQRHPAVDEMGLAGNVACLVAGKKEGEQSDLLGRPEPAHRLTVDKGLSHYVG